MHQIKKCKTSFFEWFEVKVCILKSEAVINDQNRFLFFGTPCIHNEQLFHVIFTKYNHKIRQLEPKYNEIKSDNYNLSIMNIK